MKSLLNKENEKGRNVLEHVIVRGAEAFLREILDSPLEVFEVASNSREVIYDVTNFTNTPTKGGSLCHGRCGRSSISPETNVTRVLIPATEDGSIPPGNAENQNKSAPRKSCLDLIVENGHRWENTNILQMEPIATIITPMLVFMYTVNSAIFWIQLFYVIV